MPKVVRRTYSNGEMESLDDLLRRFRRQVNDANILGECRKREFFISNSEKKKEKRLKRQMAIRKAKQEAKREEYREQYYYNMLMASQYKSTAKKEEKPVSETAAPAPVAKPVATKPAYYSYRKAAPKTSSEEGK